MSHKDLGSNWSPSLEIRENHRLVTEGIYQHIRHPMYSAMFLLMVAQAMILPNYVAGFSGIIPFAALYVLRVRREERMMAGEFGEEYAEYRQENWPVDSSAEITLTRLSSGHPRLSCTISKPLGKEDDRL